jgi:predicted TIM-barrel fold metal-dependent hydrolase
MMTSAFSVGQKEGKGIYWKIYAPFFIEMKNKQLLNDFAHIASITTGNEQNIKWISDHQDKLKEFYTWFNDYTWQ